MTKVKKAPKKAPKTGTIKAEIKILGTVYKSTGSTAKEAIENLKPLGTSRGMSILSMTNGEVKRVKVISSPQVFRLFNGSRLAREIALKNVSLMFSDL